MRKSLGIHILTGTPGIHSDRFTGIRSYRSIGIHYDRSTRVPSSKFLAIGLSLLSDVCI